MNTFYVLYWRFEHWYWSLPITKSILQVLSVCLSVCLSLRGASCCQIPAVLRGMGLKSHLSSPFPSHYYRQYKLSPLRHLRRTNSQLPLAVPMRFLKALAGYHLPIPPSPYLSVSVIFSEPLRLEMSFLSIAIVTPHLPYHSLFVCP